MRRTFPALAVLACAGGLAAQQPQPPGVDTPAAPAPGTVVVMPRPDLPPEAFDTGRALPRPLPSDLTRGGKPRLDLVPEMRAFARKRFPADEYYAWEDWLRTPGDILAAFRDLRRNGGGTDVRLKELERRFPKIHAELEPWLGKFVRADQLYSPRWRPGRDGERDGMAMLPPWFVNPHPLRAQVWNDLPGSRAVHQGAAFIYADLAAIRRVALDYANYHLQVGRDLEWVHPIPGTLYRAPPGERPYLAHSLRFEGRLPFPFGRTHGRMELLEGAGAAGLWEVEFYTEGEDFHWFAGRDTFIPVRDAQGGFVGTLVVSQAGVDVEGVPDSSAQREKLVRASLGNWKRLAEALYEARGAVPRPDADAAALPVTGGSPDGRPPAGR